MHKYFHFNRITVIGISVGIFQQQVIFTVFWPVYQYFLMCLLKQILQKGHMENQDLKD